MFGIENNTIVLKDVIDYMYGVIPEKSSDYEIMIQILGTDEDEIEAFIKKLALKENRQNMEEIVSKWMFLIIYYYYINNNNNIYNIIDEIYCDFNYPSEISGLVSYMPAEEGKLRDNELEEYIKRGKELWF
ncbi:MAG: DUF2247 family protein [Lachnospiraceae bacterium]|nr:DUF2247 family protein [Lachnospiraceae bacterium]